jgi:hypothetical protein
VLFIYKKERAAKLLINKNREFAFRGLHSRFHGQNSEFPVAKPGVLVHVCGTRFPILRWQMRNEVQQTAGVLAEKRGVPIYTSNPSVPSADEIKKPKRTRLGTELRGLVVDNGSGEVLGHGGAMVYEWEEVDKERFVKLYLAGLKQAAGLSKAGLAVFELVYNQLQRKPGQDTITLSLLTAGMKKTTYYGGLRELLEKEFLFRSPYDGTFFVNIRFMFNGDRLAFVKGYKLKKDQPTLPGLELTPILAPALSAPDSA